MNLIRKMLIPGLAIFFTFSFTLIEQKEEWEQALEKIDLQNIRAYIKFLSDDLFEGRGTGTRGHELAAQYVANQFDLMGLKPGGENGTFFQDVALKKGNKDFAGSEISLFRNKEKISFSYMDDYVFIDGPSENITGKSEILFAGFGIYAPDKNHNDYKNLNIKDKFVVLFSGAPAGFSSDFPASTRSAKFAEAKKRGAKGIIYMIRPEEMKTVTWEVLQNYFADPNGHGMSLREETSANKTIEIILSPSGMSKLLGEQKPDDLINKKKNSAVKNIEYSLNLKTDHIENLTSPNVIGILEGTDPALKSEYIVYTAHLDHEGIGKPVDGDSIYNGAYDNASGTAIILEIAEAFASLSQKPKRSIMFIALTAEEKGLLGSRYFAANPTVPISSIAANINTDMFLMEEALNEIVVLGAPFSDLGQYAEEAARYLELEIVPDPVPEENLFVRSDHYSFVEKGVPALFVVNNYRKASSDSDTTAVNTRWLKTIYHSPKDEFYEEMNFEAGVKYGRFNFMVGYKAAQQAEKIRWKKDNVFGQRFGS
ncbi:MAG: M20/M25/M40 family metallo-hydrolase [Bacteroidota bacterium]|nr:M20/M25/M40 family metallo-hydrolase [Bacteroidota bacterium]